MGLLSQFKLGEEFILGKEFKKTGHDVRGVLDLLFRKLAQNHKLSQEDIFEIQEKFDSKIDGMIEKDFNRTKLINNINNSDKAFLSKEDIEDFRKNLGLSNEEMKMINSISTQAMLLDGILDIESRLTTGYSSDKFQEAMMKGGVFVSQSMQDTFKYKGETSSIIRKIEQKKENIELTFTLNRIIPPDIDSIYMLKLSFPQKDLDVKNVGEFYENANVTAEILMLKAAQNKIAEIFGYMGKRNGVIAKFKKVGIEPPLDMNDSNIIRQQNIAYDFIDNIKNIENGYDELSVLKKRSKLFKPKTEEVFKSEISNPLIDLLNKYQIPLNIYLVLLKEGVDILDPVQNKKLVDNSNLIKNTFDDPKSMLQELMVADVVENYGVSFDNKIAARRANIFSYPENKLQDFISPLFNLEQIYPEKNFTKIHKIDPINSALYGKYTLLGEAVEKAKQINTQEQKQEFFEYIKSLASEKDYNFQLDDYDQESLEKKARSGDALIDSMRLLTQQLEDKLKSGKEIDENILYENCKKIELNQFKLDVTRQNIYMPKANGDFAKIQQSSGVVNNFESHLYDFGLNENGIENAKRIMIQQNLANDLAEMFSKSLVGKKRSELSDDLAQSSLILVDKHKNQIFEINGEETNYFNMVSYDKDNINFDIYSASYIIEQDNVDLLDKERIINLPRHLKLSIAKNDLNNSINLIDALKNAKFQYEIGKDVYVELNPLLGLENDLKPITKKLFNVVENGLEADNLSPKSPTSGVGSPEFEVLDKEVGIPK